jgi:thiamine biosynthesis protein ThiS
MTHISIVLNGQPKDIAMNVSVQALLEEAGYGDMMIAVARNGEFVPRGTYDDVVLCANDDVEIVAPMQGG